MTEKQSEPISNETGATWVDYTRWFLALAAVAGAAVLAIGSNYLSDLQVCEFKPSYPDKEKCSPLPIESTIPLLVLALALMWKDLSEISISGLGRVVRRIDDNQQKLQEGQAELRGQFSMIQSQTFNANLYVGLEEESERVRRREPSVAAKAEETSTAWSDLEDTWQRLAPWSDLAKRLRDPYFLDFLRSTELAPAELEAKLSSSDRDLISTTGLGPEMSVSKLEAWASAARPRLELVRKVIRAGPTLAEDQAKQALAVAQDLLLELQTEGLAKSG